MSTGSLQKYENCHKMRWQNMWMLIGIYFLQAKRFNDYQSSSFGFRLCNDSKHEFHLYKNLAFNEQNFYFGRRMLRFNIFSVETKMHQKLKSFALQL